MKILGIAGALGHDPAAALVIDGEVVAAAEEERFIRDKHAKGQLPKNTLQWLLSFAQIKPDDIDAVALSYAPFPLFYKGRWHYAKRYWYAPDRALDVLFNGNRRFRRHLLAVRELLQAIGFSKDIKIIPVEHHLAHASSAYHVSGFTGKSAILGIDGKGEYATTFLGYGENGRIHKIKEFYDPDSLGGLYGALTEFLGFEMLDGEFKVMGMAPYGDPERYDLSRLLKTTEKSFRVNTQLVNVVGWRRYKKNNQGYYFSKKLIDWLGPMREGDSIDEPYIHYAANLQQLLERVTQQLVDHYLGDILQETGRLCFAGGTALNVKLNQRLMARPDVQQLFVQPAANDPGTAIGAATYVSQTLQVTPKKQHHTYLGPSYTLDECEAALQEHPAKPRYTKLSSEEVVKRGADILASGEPLAWFQGRMEFGPRALGNRSILGDPSHRGIADRINAQIKYRERWRPFCPSILDSVAAEILQTTHPSPYMTFTFEVAPEWREKIPEVVHEDGTARAQVVTRAVNARYYDLIKALEQKTGIGVVLNTSLNRRGEPMVCAPVDALNMFYGCDLKYLMLEDYLIIK